MASSSEPPGSNGRQAKDPLILRAADPLSRICLNPIPTVQGAAFPVKAAPFSDLLLDF